MFLASRLLLVLLVLVILVLLALTTLAAGFPVSSSSTAADADANVHHSTRERPERSKRWSRARAEPGRYSRLRVLQEWLVFAALDVLKIWRKF